MILDSKFQSIFFVVHKTIKFNTSIICDFILVLCIYRIIPHIFNTILNSTIVSNKIK